MMTRGKVHLTGGPGSGQENKRDTGIPRPYDLRMSGEGAQVKAEAS